MRSILFVFLSFSSVQFSFCPTYPRMVMHFSYDKPREDVILEMRNFLIEDGFVILEYAPNDGFLFTDYKLYDWGEGQRFISVIVNIQDKMTITGQGKMDIPVSGIGNNDELLKIKTFDNLPYKIQKKTVLTLIKPLEKLGYKKMNHWP
ncbi:MAG: hypothetical protein HOB40_01115 [Candidatus Marinimicrobia bacterium]|nr:hypothetical protein [Candidatus Neomarinimicrobiota bacterium]MBT3502318.1 hypothetical protein [Candidatus Neomarinimicrobiota bacterium]MBT3999465.1 hypothetical protein [Candidatus Neomarinimicrobiota bacterium]MBT4282058.1 hypothetical protein [Candidatus Neomarinimicrobiota bacterium]MBT4578555.1 hypothetical protein [Candidatus Neomarinimicrobiota bacterium]